MIETLPGGRVVGRRVIEPIPVWEYFLTTSLGILFSGPNLQCLPWNHVVTNLSPLNMLD